MFLGLFIYYYVNERVIERMRKMTVQPKDAISSPYGSPTGTGKAIGIKALATAVSPVATSPAGTEVLRISSPGTPAKEIEMNDRKSVLATENVMFSNKDKEASSSVKVDTSGVEDLKNLTEAEKAQAKAKLQARLQNKPKNEKGESLPDEKPTANPNEDEAIMKKLMEESALVDGAYSKEAAEKDRAKAKLQARLAAKPKTPREEPSLTTDSLTKKGAEVDPDAVLKNMEMEAKEIENLKGREKDEKAIAKAKLEARLNKK